jgi:DNA repair photolyase
MIYKNKLAKTNTKADMTQEELEAFLRHVDEELAKLGISVTPTNEEENEKPAEEPKPKRRKRKRPAK